MSKLDSVLLLTKAPIWLRKLTLSCWPAWLAILRQRRPPSNLTKRMALRVIYGFVALAVAAIVPAESLAAEVCLSEVSGHDVEQLREAKDGTLLVGTNRGLFHEAGGFLIPIPARPRHW